MDQSKIIVDETYIWLFSGNKYRVTVLELNGTGGSCRVDEVLKIKNPSDVLEVDRTYFFHYSSLLPFKS